MNSVYDSAVFTSNTELSSKLKGDGRKILIIGGSGFLSGSIQRLAKKSGFQVWILTRGKRPIPNSVIQLQADRNNSIAFSNEIANTGIEWDVVIDCIGMQPEHAIQDIKVFNNRSRHYIFVSTDSVYDPAKREYPQPTNFSSYVTEGYGYLKRRCEEIIVDSAPNSLPWTIIRPCHIYGPGAYLGCLPPSLRDPLLLHKIRDRESISLAGGGYFLHQPIFVDDLALLILSLANNSLAYGKVLNTPGGKLDTMRVYYEVIASILGQELKVNEISVVSYLADHPEHASSVCHRIYDDMHLKDIGVLLPRTTLEEGMQATISKYSNQNSDINLEQSN